MCGCCRGCHTSPRSTSRSPSSSLRAPLLRSGPTPADGPHRPSRRRRPRRQWCLVVMERGGPDLCDDPKYPSYALPILPRRLNLLAELGCLLPLLLDVCLRAVAQGGPRWAGSPRQVCRRPRTHSRCAAWPVASPQRPRRNRSLGPPPSAGVHGAPRHRRARRHHLGLRHAHLVVARRAVPARRPAHVVLDRSAAAGRPHPAPPPTLAPTLTRTLAPTPSPSPSPSQSRSSSSSVRSPPSPPPRRSSSSSSSSPRTSPPSSSRPAPPKATRS